MRNYPYIGLYRNLRLLSDAQAALILIFFGFLAFHNAIYHPFIHDDIVFIVENPQIGNLSLPSIYSIFFPSLSGGGIVNQYYRPLLELIYRLEYKMFSFNPWYYHLANIIIHLFNGFLVYLLMGKVFDGKKIAALIIALFFLVHPLQGEAVSTISGISNLVYVSFSLMSFLLYLAASNRNTMRSVFVYLSSLFFYALALMAKEQAIVLPFLILLYGLLVSRGKDVGGKFFKFGCINYFVVAVFYFLFRRVVTGFSLAGFLDFKGELILRVLAIPRTVLTYLRMVFFPHDLHYYRSTDILAPNFLSAALLLAIIPGIFLLIKKAKDPNRNILIFGLSWFLVTISPVLNIIPLVNEYSLILTAEHFMYLPVIGIFIFIVAILQPYFLSFEEKGPVNFFAVVTAVLLTAAVSVTIKNNTYWENEISLFSRTLRYEKDFGRVRILLAKAYFREGLFNEAVRQYENALVIFEGYLRKAQNEQARKVYENFTEIAYADMGASFLALNNYAQAIKYFNLALRLNPNNAFAHNNLGVSFIGARDFMRARDHFEKALDLNTSPDSQAARRNLAILSGMKKGN
ncbi:MAG: tetratricopeptide repeat protein [Candidatus Omnitrophica bacterium]|nr:tetratricopeptide repeat protein [Candidatus Omnitrophota bacterium]